MLKAAGGIRLAMVALTRSCPFQNFVHSGTIGALFGGGSGAEAPGAE